MRRSDACFSQSVAITTSVATPARRDVQAIGLQINSEPLLTWFLGLAEILPAKGRAPGRPFVFPAAGLPAGEG
jgi:hypothetical protein